MTRLESIVQALYDRLSPVVGSGLYVMRLRPFEPAECPFSNLLVLGESEPMDDLPVTSRRADILIVSAFTGEALFAQAETRRKAIHDTLLADRRLGGLAVSTKERGTHFDPEEQQPILRLAQAYRIEYRAPRETL